MPEGTQRSVRSLLFQRHLQFVLELVVGVLLGAALWILIIPNSLVIDRDIYGNLHVYLPIGAWVRYYVLQGIASLLLVIIYYGTSFSVTPLKLFLPFLQRFVRLSDAAAGSATGLFGARTNSESGLDPNGTSGRAVEEEILDRVADSEVENISKTTTVDEILRVSAHSSAKLALKMERRINTHLILCVLVGGAGLVVWWMIFFFQGGTLDKSQELLQKGSFTNQLLFGVLPRITILLFIELLAGFFLRQYRIGVEDLKYFLELRRRADAKRVAYAILERHGDQKAQLKFAEQLIGERSDTRLLAGETTTTLDAISKEQNEVSKGIGMFADKLVDILKVIKK